MSDCNRQVRIQEADFDAGAELAALYHRCRGDLGAVATFIGLVRDRFQDAPVEALHLEHYPGMTEKSIHGIVDQAAGRWPLLDVLVIHRVGELAGREQVVYVQVASSHREAAFSTVRFIMDYLKTDAVFWKREVQPGRIRWVESTAADRASRAAWEDGAADREGSAADREDAAVDRGDSAD